MNRKQICSLAIFLLCASLFYAGQSATKVAKMGDKAATKGNYYSAAISYLDALDKKPKSTKTQQKLAKVAKPAYDQKLKLGEEYRNNENLEGALKEYQELEQFVERLRKYNALDFMTIDFADTVSTVSEGAAETRYKNAESYFAAQNYDKAIEEYEAARGLKSPYKDCLDKLSESCYRIGTANENSGAYRKAAEIYMQSCVTVPNYKDARKKAVSIYYALGNYFLDAGQFRLAFEDFSRAQDVDPQFSDLAAKLAQAEERATIRVAFVRFDNPTGRNIAGMALGDVILENIKSKMQAGASQFIKSLDRDELLAIAQEQRISERQLDNDMSAPIKLLGVDYLIIGKLNQVRNIRTGPKVDQVAGQYRYRYSVPYVDKHGKNKTRTEYATGNMTYDLFMDGIKVTLAGTIKVIEAKTGAIVINHQIMEEGGDNVIYADNIRAEHDPKSDLVDLDAKTVKLLAGRRELLDIGEIADKMIRSIADTMANKILATLDKTPDVSDPVSLKY